MIDLDGTMNKQTQTFNFNVFNVSDFKSKKFGSVF